MPVVELKNLGKKFKIYHEGRVTLEKTLYSFFKRKRLYEEFWALKDINVEVKKGETIGIIGPNGAGKTTLLRIMAKILTPNKGSVRVEGKVSAFLSLGTGFHPDLTGLENVYLYGSVLGLSKKDIQGMLAGIIEFSELEKFIDVPVKNYSSGMLMRLAFAVAFSVNPDILLIDEVLAVGDVRFQEKCLERIAEFKYRGKTIILVSQNAGIIKKFCDKAILIDKGMIASTGGVERVIDDYFRMKPPNRHSKEKISFVRESVKSKRNIKWYLVYGPARSGTSYMFSLIIPYSKLYISDWGLQNILKITPPYEYIRLDRERALKDISDNILDNAYIGRGDRLDFAFKQAYLGFDEYEMLVKMWGEPERKIFCFREPAGYIASAKKHFSGPYFTPLDLLQKRYIKAFESYKRIGGDMFEYKPDLKLEDYISFLKPMDLDRESLPDFVYKGKQDFENVTDEMQRAYNNFKNAEIEHAEKY